MGHTLPCEWDPHSQPVGWPRGPRRVRPAARHAAAVARGVHGPYRCLRGQPHLPQCALGMWGAFATADCRHIPPWRGLAQQPPVSRLFSPRLRDLATITFLGVRGEGGEAFASGDGHLTHSRPSPM